MAKKTAASTRKSGKGKLAQAIRDEFQKNGLDTRPRDIIATLSARGIKVSPAQVSNIKSSLLQPKKPKRRPGPKADSTARSKASHDHGTHSHSHDAHTLDLSDLVDALRVAKKLIEKVGDVHLAHEILDACANLQSNIDLDDDVPF